MTTDEGIHVLLAEAEASGDSERVALCRAALAGDGAAIVECERLLEAIASQFET